MNIELPPLPEPAEKNSKGTCCGNFTHGGEYMGQREPLCCGQPDEARPDYFTADQMNAQYLKGYNYARAAIEAHEARKVPDGYCGSVYASSADEHTVTVEFNTAKHAEAYMEMLASTTSAPQVSTAHEARQTAEPVDVLAMPDTPLGREHDIDKVIFHLSMAKREAGWLVSACWVASSILKRIKELGPLYTHLAPKREPLTDEQDNALCEAYCNTASDAYFTARPQLDSQINRRIFYAGHRKAWIEYEAAHGITKEQS